MDHHIPEKRYFDRDISWLGFNDLILEQAAKNDVPVLERIKFLSIYSSNLDEFYRVRIPVMAALHRMSVNQNGNDLNDDCLQNARQIIEQQQEKFGKILVTMILPLLAENGIYLNYNTPLNKAVIPSISRYFYSEVLAFLQPVFLSRTSFYPKDNRLYFLIALQNQNNHEELAVLNIPSDELPRFFTKEIDTDRYVVFLDDIIKHHLNIIFKNQTIKGCYAFKITRDADLDLKDDYPGDVAGQIEKQLSKREFGLATRFLYQPDIPLRLLTFITEVFNLQNASVIPGGFYHNLKNFFGFPVKFPSLSYPAWPAHQHGEVKLNEPLFDQIARGDRMVHTPYQAYDNILRFFNEAAINTDVEEINVSLYRVASDSRIVNALISATKNGKRVRVVVELKARFDEANNLKWAKKLKNAGAEIIYSVIALKIHAKIALVKLKQGARMKYFGLLGTGNFNEGTAKVYTDHILMTANPALLREVELLFIFLAKRVLPEKHEPIAFEHLLVSKFNLQQRFLELIDREIAHATNKLPASIIIKLNNLEERVLIDKLYEASNAGVKISIIVRSICCLIPGVKNRSQNITVTRIVDRNLEHGRIFIFNNNYNTEVYLGSADWMNRNIYHRIEVCYPIYDEHIKKEILDIIQLQIDDKVQAVQVDSNLNNLALKATAGEASSQTKIYQLLKTI